MTLRLFLLLCLLGSLVGAGYEDITNPFTSGMRSPDKLISGYNPYRLMNDQKHFKQEIRRGFDPLIWQAPLSPTGGYHCIAYHPNEVTATPALCDYRKKKTPN